MKVRARPINPRLFEHAKIEYERLTKYMYIPSTSPIASPLVIASKATKPFIRFCGDYQGVNKYIDIGHYPIPEVRHALDDCIKYPIRADLDVTNAFHQFKLSPVTRQRLSIVTPWQQVEPLFLPEGVGPASFILQEQMERVFAGLDWVIVIFDNLLVLALNYQDLRDKCEQLFDRCLEYNLYLKFGKAWLGFPEQNFFGYVLKEKSYELNGDRYEAICRLPIPRSQKQMMSFLGAANFYSPFVPNYATLAAPMYDMTRQEFVWDAQSWTAERTNAYNVMLHALKASTAIYFPDYNLVWILYIDASKFGVGYILFQITAEGVPQIMKIGSSKFSGPAVNWSTIEQECYAMYYALLKADYYLRCKHFIMRTDHNNLRWMESSLVPKIIRWRIHMQSFDFMVMHHPGKSNPADFWSRDGLPIPHNLQALFCDEEVIHTAPDMLAALAPIVITAPDAMETSKRLASVHGKRMGHHGARRTYQLLNKYHPGHRISLAVVQDYVSECPICQKTRLGHSDALVALPKTLLDDHRRKRVGADFLTVSPADKYGNMYIATIVVHTTKLTALYASPTKTAEDMARALFQFFATYGTFDILLTDPGPEFRSAVINQLSIWLGVEQQTSLVERHESNGVEHTNGAILRHLQALVLDEEVKDCWSAPENLSLSLLHIYSTLQSTLRQDYHRLRPISVRMIQLTSNCPSTSLLKNRQEPQRHGFLRHSTKIVSPSGTPRAAINIL